MRGGGSCCIAVAAGACLRPAGRSGWRSRKLWDGAVSGCSGRLDETISSDAANA